MINIWECPRCGLRIREKAQSAQTVTHGCTSRGTPMVHMNLVDSYEESFDCGDYALKVVPSWD